MTNKENNATLLGDKLKQEREAAKLTVDDIAYKTRIPVKYISLLEEGNYKNLPAEVYVRGFVSKYAEVLGLDKDNISKIYSQESVAFNKTRIKKNEVPTLKYPRFVITPRLIAVALGIIFFVGIFGYFGKQVYFLIKPPQVLLETMQDDFVTEKENHLLRGSVIGANILTINNKTINFNESGQFSEYIDLSNGLNVIELKAENKFGKVTTLVRKVILNK